MRGKRLFISRAIRKPGALHRQIGVPAKERIPRTFLTRIAEAPLGTTVTNPTQTGKAKVTVTPLLKKRAVLAKTLRNINT